MANPILSRQMVQMGANLRNWRKIQGLTTELTAERAGISRDTLRAIETGRSTSVESLFSVMRVLGVLDAVVTSTNPLNTDFGARNFGRTNAERVRTGRTSAERVRTGRTNAERVRAPR